MIKKLANSVAPKNLALLVSLTLIYYVAGRLGLRISFVRPVPPIWLPSGISIAAFILFGYRVWPAILAGCFLGSATEVGFTPGSFIIPAAALLEGFTASYFVNKFARGVKAFDTAKGVFLFVLFACICGPSISATVGVGMLYLGGHIPWVECGFRWLTWWLGHGTGVLLVSPFLILLLRAPHHRLDWREAGELAVLLLGLIFVCLLVFGPLSLSLNKNHVTQAWLCIPFLIWAAFRFCPLEAAGTTLILFGSAIWGTLHGYGSFVAKDLMISLVLLDTFIGVMGTMTLAVAAMVVERCRVEEELLGLQSLLQAAVERKEQDILVTVQALEIEAARHAQTKRALRESQSGRES